MTRILSLVLSTTTLAVLSLSIATPAYADADLTSDPGDTSVPLIPTDQIPDVTAKDLPDDGVIYDDSDATDAVLSYFRIFYSPDCARGGSASRSYYGLNSGEHWINDRFNNSAGLSGYDQIIRQNAASILVYNAAVWISGDNGYSWTLFNSRSSTCFNLGDRGLRNRNTNWVTRSAL